LGLDIKKPGFLRLHGVGAQEQTMAEILRVAQNLEPWVLGLGSSFLWRHIWIFHVAAA
jgi:hypothetical protein